MKQAIVEIVRNRLAQASTWAGLIVLAASLCGYSLSETSDAVVQVAEGIAAAVALFEIVRNG